MAFVRYRYRDDAIHAFIVSEKEVDWLLKSESQALKGPEFYHPWLVHWTSNVDMNNMSNMINEQRFIDKCCLFVGNLSESTSEEELNELFGQYGIIIYIRVIRKHRENEKKVFAFIKYQSESEANTAIQHQVKGERKGNE